MGKIEQNKEKKRLAILRSAKDIFLSEGYVLASMDKIASHAQMTKQTLYRYFPSKIDLFQATLKEMGESVDDSFLLQLQNPDPRKALVGFAKEFIEFHLSEQHIATFRLLVAESDKAPEMVSSFRSIGPDSTEAKLSSFFNDRLNIEDNISIIELWTGMLLSMRSEVVMGMAKPTVEQIEQHAIKATDFLLSAIN